MKGTGSGVAFFPFCSINTSSENAFEQFMGLKTREPALPEEDMKPPICIAKLHLKAVVILHLNEEIN